MAPGWAAALPRVPQTLVSRRAWWHLPAAYQARRIVAAEDAQVTSTRWRKAAPRAPWHPPRGATSYGRAYLTRFIETESRGCSWRPAARCGRPSRVAWPRLPPAARTRLWQAPADARGDSRSGLPEPRRGDTRVRVLVWACVRVPSVRAAVGSLGRGTLPSDTPNCPPCTAFGRSPLVRQRRRARPRGPSVVRPGPLGLTCPFASFCPAPGGSTWPPQGWAPASRTSVPRQGWNE